MYESISSWIRRKALNHCCKRKVSLSKNTSQWKHFGKWYTSLYLCYIALLSAFISAFHCFSLVVFQNLHSHFEYLIYFNSFLWKFLLPVLLLFISSEYVSIKLPWKITFHGKLSYWSGKDPKMLSYTLQNQGISVLEKVT